MPAVELVESLLNDIKHGVIVPPSQSAGAPSAPPAQPAAKPTKPAATKPESKPTAAKPEVAKAKAAAAPQAKAAAAKAGSSPAPAAAATPPTSDLPPTDALYQTDTYLFAADATVIGITPLDGDQGFAVVLDRTCFHPQGGGQPADTGSIAGGSGEPFGVAMVKKDASGVVSHIGPSAPSFDVGSKVKLDVDGALRVKQCAPSPRDFGSRAPHPSLTLSRPCVALVCTARVT